MPDRISNQFWGYTSYRVRDKMPSRMSECMRDKMSD